MTDPSDSLGSPTGDRPIATAQVQAGAGMQSLSVGSRGRETQEHKAEETARAELSDRQLIQQMMQSMQQIQRSLEPLQAKISTLEQQQQSSALKATTRRQSMAPFTLSSPSADLSASAALPLPPVVAQWNRRQSHGMPLPPDTPATPARNVNFEDEADTEEHEESAKSAASESDSRRLVELEKQWERASKALAQVVKPFYGQSNKDGDNIIDWVEKVDTIFSIRMKDRPDGRLDLVRQMLAGTALKWMNRCVQELNEQMSRGEISGPVEWNLLRQPFIDAHLGVNTIETFKAELRTLRLGSTKCPTPVEFNKEFDHLVELAFPDRRQGAMATVLGDEYAQLIYASKPTIYKSVALNQLPSTLEEWKVSVSRRWAAGKQLDAMEAQGSRSGGQSGQQRGRGGYGGGGWKGRGGGTAGQPTQPTTAAAINADDRNSQEGEALTVEGDNDEQLGAADSSRGGRGGSRGGGRGGRGGGGAGQTPRLSDERLKKLAEEGKCFRCGQTGHISRGCTNPRVDLSKE
jgi:hypothetical protein